MREILFRGKRIDNGEWVEGFYVERNGTSWIYPAGDPIISRSLARELRPGHSAKSTQKIMREVFPVDPKTVGQYTGLTANGKKIFEGDIFEWGYAGVKEFRYVVAYDAQLASFVGERHFGFVSLNGIDIEIIGNIHDNPELLEGGNT